MLPLTVEQIEVLARAYDSPEMRVVRGWIASTAERLTRDALRTANPQLCGAAEALTDLAEELFDIQYQYQTLRNTPGSAAPTP